MIGNFMNGTGIKGGAFGFKISSINKVGHAPGDVDPIDDELACRHKISP